MDTRNQPNPSYVGGYPYFLLVWVEGALQGIFDLLYMLMFVSLEPADSGVTLLGRMVEAKAESSGDSMTTFQNS